MFSVTEGVQTDPSPSGIVHYPNRHRISPVKVCGLNNSSYIRYISILIEDSLKLSKK